NISPTTETSHVSPSGISMVLITFVVFCLPECAPSIGSESIFPILPKISVVIATLTHPRPEDFSVKVRHQVSSSLGVKGDLCVPRNNPCSSPRFLGVRCPNLVTPCYLNTRVHGYKTGILRACTYRSHEKGLFSRKAETHKYRRLSHIGNGDRDSLHLATESA